MTYQTMRLIDANALIKKLSDLWNVHDDQDFCNKDVWREIENAPTVEIPDITAKVEWWGAHDETGICERCGCPTLETHYNYCPMCGARLVWGEE